MADRKKSRVIADQRKGQSDDDRGNRDSGSTGTSRGVEETLRNQVENWRKKLLDLGNRNSLINCSFSQSHGVLEILNPNTETVWRKIAADNEAGDATMRFPWRRDLIPMPGDLQPNEGEAEREWNPPLNECLRSQRLRPTDLMTGSTDKALNRRFRTLANHAELSLSEQGVHCLYVAFGFLKWFESVDSEQELRSPLMLVPVSLNRSTSDAPWELSEADDDAQENLCLRQRLKQDFGLELPPLPDIAELEEEGARLRFLDAVRLTIAENSRWQVEDRCAIGRFAFPKIAMWKNLGDYRNEVISHPICRSIAGDSSVSPMQAFGSTKDLPDASRLDDELAPGDIKAILDCDSSQMEAIVAARRGVSFVLDGPPGTGKSQTIANIIADALGEGRRVLFVSEKVSALEVVKRRLDEVGLGDFCLECHSSKGNRAAVIEKLRMSLEIQPEVYPDAASKLDEAKRIREALNEYVRTIHAPRAPLGLSPYELYGQISRLDRLGMSTKSRCALPNPSGVHREQFNLWLKVLERAEDVGVVIAAYATHPWRGCKLTSRTLSLSDDIQHHFGTLSKSFRAIHTATCPLVDAGLLQVATPKNLVDISKWLQDAVFAPDVPLSWFTNPSAVASAALSRNDAIVEFQQIVANLGDYCDDVVTRFPEECVNALKDTNSKSWLRRIKESLPDNLREQHRVIVDCATSLSDVAQNSESVELALSELMEQLQIPLSTKVLLAEVPSLLQLVRSVANCIPMKAGWLALENWSRLRQSCQDALGNLDDANMMAATLNERLSPQKIMQLCSAVPEPQVVEAAWDRIHSIVGEGKTDDILARYRSAVEIAESLTHAQDALVSICRCVGIRDATAVSYEAAKGLSTWGAALTQSVTFHGAWSDPSARVKVRKACSAAMNDLVEADELRRGLEDRLSHRAFKSSAVDLVRRSSGFSTLIGRMFGGYRGFRKEIAELYKQPVPPTQQLLSDLDRLRVYHRRANEADEAALSIATMLPESHIGSDLEAWRRVAGSLDIFHALCQSVPTLANNFRLETANLDLSEVRSRSEQIQSDLDRVQELIAGSSFSTWMFEGGTLANITTQVRTVVADLKTCLDVVECVGSHCEQPPATFPQLLTDLLNASRYSESVAEAAAIFEREREFMPHGSIPTDRGGWERTLAGVMAAENLSRLVRKPDILRETLCYEGRIDSVGLKIACDSADAAIQKLRMILTATEALIVVSTPGERAVEPLKRTPGGLTRIAGTGSKQLEAHADRLNQIVSVVRSNRDIPLARLTGDAALVRKAHLASEAKHQAEELLLSLGATSPEDLSGRGVDAAKWLAVVSSSGVVQPLMQAAASDIQIREQAKDAAERIMAACRGSYEKSWEFLTTVFEEKSETSLGYTPTVTPFGELSDLLDRLKGETESLEDWLKFVRWRRDMQKQGLDAVVEEVLAVRYEPHEVVDAVSARFYRSLFDHLVAHDSTLAEFDLDSHERLRERFRQLDTWEVKAAVTRIRQYQLGRKDRPRQGEMIPGSSELGILMKEAKKKRRHMPLRKLFTEIPKVLQALKPCIMMSPLSVSTFLQSTDIQFDLVIFDEASQVFPWDAVGAIYRGTQLIVAGDEKQLPPTNFFNRADVESEDEDDEIGDFESILSLCKSINMPNKQLRWHYRSRREPLIAFSNRHFYGGDLVTFPSVRDASRDAVRLDLVPHGRWIDRKNRAEAERVADLVVEHYRQRSTNSLGVIAFNTSQQNAIEDAIYERRRQDAEIDAMFEVHATEPFFVKNLENVQGDERDVIILSMGYSYNDAGKFLKNFGPLTKAGGARRLNVAVTRARESVVLIASVRAADMDLSGSTSEGAHLLKAYLEYAERGVESLATSVTLTNRDCESPFEEEVTSALIRQGLEPVPQVGCGGFRIDLALKHPKRPGEFCLGIECDGATYHSSRTARDRDRIRQSVLEDLGWRIVRVWSTDWIRNPGRQLQRIVSEFEKVISDSDRHATTLESDLPDDDLTPRIVNHSRSVGQTFSKIEDVPDGQIRKSAAIVLTRAGATDWDDLVTCVARELGFFRTGKKIKERIELVLNRQLRSGELHWVGDRIASNPDNT